MASRPNPTVAPSERAPDLEIVGDNVILHQTAVAGGSEALSGITERRLVSNMARFRENPFEFLREVSLFVSGSGWRAYDDVIGPPVFYSGYSDKMKQDIAKQPMLRAKISQLAETRANVEQKEGLLDLPTRPGDNPHLHRKSEIESQLQQVCDEMMDKMVCKMENKRFIRGAYYLATQLLTRAYHQGVHVSSEEVLRLRSVARKAAEKRQSIIFLPSHKSHIDYLSLQIICYRLNMVLPIVVAGDNLNFPLVGAFLQHAGAMWIRRSFGDDPLYRTLVQSYIDTILQNGYNFECFIEGGRSRMGKVLPPKFGILSFVLDSILSGRVEDAIVCPVSTQYDKVLETESYVSELLGQPKAKENLMSFLSASSVLSLRLGRVDVRFSEPWSLRQYACDQLARIYSSQSISLPMHVENAEKSRLLRTLGYRVLSEINHVSVVMPTALVGTVLLTLRGRGVGKSELVRRVDWLIERIKAKGGRVAHFYKSPTEHVVVRALDDLGSKLVREVGGLAEPTYYAVDRFQLSFYRNMTIHLFVPEALVSAALYSRVKQGGGPLIQRMPYSELVEQVGFLSQLFRGEFIYSQDGLVTNIENTLSGLEQDHIVKITRDPSDTPTFIELDERERHCGRENYDFYCFLIWPFIEAAWLGTISLMGLTPPPDRQNPWVDMKNAQDVAQLLGKTLYHQGTLSYFEAVNKEALKNGYQRFRDEGIIMAIPGKNRASPTMMRIAPDWTLARDEKTGSLLAEGKLWSLMDKISLSRREGKSRRDEATVSNHVLALSDMLGRKVFDASIAAAASMPEDLRTKRSARL